MGGAALTVCMRVTFQMGVCKKPNGSRKTVLEGPSRVGVGVG